MWLDILNKQVVLRRQAWKANSYLLEFDESELTALGLEGG